MSGGCRVGLGGLIKAERGWEGPLWCASSWSYVRHIMGGVKLFFKEGVPGYTERGLIKRGRAISLERDQSCRGNEIKRVGHCEPGFEVMWGEDRTLEVLAP